MKPKYFQITTKNKTLTHILVCEQFKATTTKTDEVSIKPKYIKITNKNKTLIHQLYTENSKQQQPKHIN